MRGDVVATLAITAGIILMIVLAIYLFTLK
jgi:hypothetical protein